MLQGFRGDGNKHNIRVTEQKRFETKTKKKQIAVLISLLEPSESLCTSKHNAYIVPVRIISLAYQGTSVSIRYTINSRLIFQKSRQPCPLEVLFPVNSINAV